MPQPWSFPGLTSFTLLASSSILLSCSSSLSWTSSSGWGWAVGLAGAVRGWSWAEAIAHPASNATIAAIGRAPPRRRRASKRSGGGTTIGSVPGDEFQIDRLDDQVFGTRPVQRGRAGIGSLLFFCPGLGVVSPDVG